MAISQHNKQRKHDAIRKKYRDMKAEKANGVQKYTSAYIISKLADEFYLKSTTIENIVWKSDGK